MEEESWRVNLGSVIMEASRGHLETARSLPEAPTWHSESPRRHPGSTQEAARVPKAPEASQRANSNPSQLK